ncbi:MAG: fibronectin type III domain-containing protein, partial [Candidatus Paceibacterota bacterium]
QKIKRGQKYEECTCDKYKCLEEKQTKECSCNGKGGYKCLEKNKKGECKKKSETKCDNGSDASCKTETECKKISTTECAVKLKCVTKTADFTNNIQIKVSPPDNNNHTIRGTGAVTCTGNNCKATDIGPATITVEFPKTKAEVKGKEEGANKAEDTAALKFNGISQTYRFEVYDPNRPPVVSNCGASNIGYNDGRITWSYTDADGDAQKKAYIQVSRNSAFSDFTYGVNVVRNDNRTTLDIDGLILGTKYYFRVKANDSKIDGAWCNTGSFNTKTNNPPDLNNLTCGATSGSTDYTNTNLSWKYTGIDESDDELVLKARYKRNPEDTDWTVINLPANKEGAKTIQNLISGYLYGVQLSLNDKANDYLGDRWKGCGTVTPPNYPASKVEFSLNGDGKTVTINKIDDTKTSTGLTTNEILEVKTGDRVNTNWNITNAVGVTSDSCKISTTNINTDGKGIASQIFNASSQPFQKQLSGGILPVNPYDQTYAVKLECPGKQAKTIQNLDAAIRLKVLSYPTVSCSIDGKTIVKESDESINIKANVGNVIGYSWIAGVDNNKKDKNTQSGNKTNNPNPDILNLALNYRGTAF